MAKDPVCGMYVEEKPDSVRYIMNGKEYFFCRYPMFKRI